jgi:hypothetical protein
VNGIFDIPAPEARKKLAQRVSAGKRRRNRDKPRRGGTFLLGVLRDRNEFESSDFVNMLR